LLNDYSILVNSSDPRQRQKLDRIAGSEQLYSRIEGVYESIKFDKRSKYSFQIPLAIEWKESNLNIKAPLFLHEEIRNEVICFLKNQNNIKIKLDREAIKLFRGMEKIVQAKLMTKFWKDKDINMVLHLDKKIANFIIANPNDSVKEKQLWRDILEDLKIKVMNRVEETLYDLDEKYLNESMKAKKVHNANNISSLHDSVVETIEHINRKVHHMYIHCEQKGKFNEFKIYNLKIFTNGDSSDTLEWRKLFEPFMIEMREVDLTKEIESDNIMEFIEFLDKYTDKEEWIRDEFSRRVSHIFNYARIIDYKFKSKTF
jgi:hypothetical protein